MHAPTSPVVRAGLLAGALLYLHALLPNSHAYPFLWPVLGGALAVAWSVRRSHARASVAHTLGQGLTAGGVAALLAACALVPTYLVLTTDAGAPLARLLGGAGPVPFEPRVLLVLALAMLLAVPAGAVGSALARPFARAA